MMRIAKLVLLLLLAGMLILVVNADGIDPLVYQYHDPDITIVFSEPLDTLERQQKIADEIVGISSCTINNPNGLSPDNIICTLFGHDLAPMSTVTATHHKVREHAPRCLMELYHVTYCERCEYTESSLESSFYIFCCPED